MCVCVCVCVCAFMYIYYTILTYNTEDGLLGISLRNCRIRIRTCAKESFDPTPDATPVQGVPNMVKQKKTSDIRLLSCVCVSVCLSICLSVCVRAARGSH